MSDIAEKLNVSTVTVSKALAGKEGVSDELRSEILRMAESMGYQKRGNKAKDLSAGYTVGIVTSRKYIEKGHSFYWTLYERLLTYLSQKGHVAILEVVSEEDEDLLILPRLIQEGRVDGLIVMGSFSDAYRESIAAAGTPFVALDSFHAKFRQDSIISDGYYGMYVMTHHLLRMGHKDIMFVGSIDATSSITDRYYGYCLINT